MAYKLTHIKVDNQNDTIVFHFDTSDKNTKDLVYRDFYDITLLKKDVPTFLSDINFSKNLPYEQIDTQNFTPQESPIELSSTDIDNFINYIVSPESTIDYQIHTMHDEDNKVYPVYVTEGIHLKDFTKVNNEILKPGSFIEFIYKGNKIHRDLLR